MLYTLSEIEDQCLDALRFNISNVNVRTHAGEISRGSFEDPKMLEGFIDRLPFLYVQYQGRRSEPRGGMDVTAQIWYHTLKFRIYSGTLSLRIKKEGQRSNYSQLASVYDVLHGRWLQSAAYTRAPNLLGLAGGVITAAVTSGTTTRLTVAKHGKATGDLIYVYGATGKTVINNTSGTPYWTATKVDDNTVSIPVYDSNAYTASSGSMIAAISTSGFPTPQTPFLEAGGDDERLLVNLPQITVYQADFTMKLIA